MSKVSGNITASAMMGGATIPADRIGGILYPYFEAWASSQSVSQSTWVDMDFDNAIANTDTSLFTHSTSTNPEQITVNQSGMYWIFCSNGWVQNSTGVRGLRLTINGITDSARVRQEALAGGSQSCRQHFEIMWPLTAGDVLRVQILQDAVNPLSTQASQALTNFRLFYVGKAY
jgi:hypothetical protein